MGSIKNKAYKNDNESKHTLTEAQINTLMQYRQVAQNGLDKTLQEITSVYLHEVAVNSLGYPPNSKLGFRLALDQSEDNITITSLE